MSSKGKRRESQDELSFDSRTPIHKRSRLEEVEGEQKEEPLITTPTKPRRGRPPGSGKSRPSLTNGNSAVRDIKNLSVSRSKPSTPSKVRLGVEESESVPLVRNADRSARRKSARSLLDRTASKDASEGEDEDEDLLARKIWEADEEADSSEQEMSSENGEPSAAGASLSKKKPKQRRKSPNPPNNLPPHEQYFWQNRSGRVKTSNNSLSSLSMLSHEQYHDQMSAYKDPHESSYHFLHSLHKRSFPQWRFELSESFNVCLYGYGSKRKLVTDFANYLHKHLPSAPKIFIVNGYTQTLTLRTLLTKLAPLIYDCPATSLPKLPTQPRDLLFELLAKLPRIKPQDESSRIFVFINSLDAAPLRRGNIPALLSHLAAQPSISLLATCDTPNFPLLWDVPSQTRYNFAFHDTTTFISFASGERDEENSTGPPEIPNVIDSVNELLGRSGRTIKGKEGVGFVLRSLPENARNLYRVLIEEILAGMDANLDGTDHHMQDDGEGDEDTGGGRAAAAAGIEYKLLYQKTVEEFICSSEMGFRQLLKEFWDHDMIVSKRESAVGGEVLGVPFRREEMEAILEELVE